MEYRKLGRTGMDVSTVSFGAWAIGADWGPVDDDESVAALHTALEMGVNFIDTADVYGDGRSEKLIAQVLKERDEEIFVATKAGQRLDPHVPEGYKDLERFIDRSLKNLDVEALDLLQLHCPPTEVYYMPEVFDQLDGFVKKGKIRYYGVSVEKVEEALKAIDYPNVQTVQIIFNMFRLRPSELFFQRAQKKQIGILARVPLASGLLAGKFTRESTFPENDHRNYNREGEAFDVGETFSGVDFETGLKAVDALEKIKPEGMSMVQFALRWTTMFDAVTCAIPGAKRPDQARENFGAADLPPLSDATMAGVQEIYERFIKNPVHYMW